TVVLDNYRFYCRRLDLRAIVFFSQIRSYLETRARLQRRILIFSLLTSIMAPLPEDIPHLSIPSLELNLRSSSPSSPDRLSSYLNSLSITERERRSLPSFEDV